MLVYRIALAKYASTSLNASGRAARWNSDNVAMIYTAASKSLACLENIVHRTYLGLHGSFRQMTIAIPDTIQIAIIKARLADNWKDYDQYWLTQSIGDGWVNDKNSSPVLRVPSVIIDDEFNYLINPKHSLFSEIKVIDIRPFFFDTRIARNLTPTLS